MSRILQNAEIVLALRKLRLLEVNTMRKTIYHLFVIIIFSVLIASCGGSGGDGETANTDCVIGTSKIGDCTL
jgi:hypothetical protein